MTSEDCVKEQARKLAVVRAAFLHSFPIGAIEQVLAEIESGQAAGMTQEPALRREESS